jgi:ABC-type lipoprotein release transport system permease subunit
MASTAALVIVLSVFNGFQTFLVDKFNRFNPPIKIEAKEGKVFEIPDNPTSDFRYSISDLEKIEGVKAVEKVLSDMVLVTYNDKQTLAALYGVSENYPKLSGLDAMVIDGNFYTDSSSGIVPGVGIAGFLGIELHDFLPIKLYYPKRNKTNFANPIDAFQTCYAPPVGVFASLTPYDEQSLFVNIDFTKKLFEYETEISYIAIYLDENVTQKKVQKKIQQLVGEDFTVKTQVQQEAALYKIMQAENLIVFLILSFIFIIASFNIIGILGMLIVEKKQDISILHTLGAPQALLKKVFLMVGAMIGTFGGFLGMLLGLLGCLIQEHFKIITLGTPNSSLMLNAYPVSISFFDFIATFLLIIAVSLLTSRLSLRGLKNSHLKNTY